MGLPDPGERGDPGPRRPRPQAATDEASAGAWDAYRRATGFTMTEDERLGRHLLPYGGRVLVFRRDTATG